MSEENLRRIEELKKRYPHPQAVVLEALWMWQGEHGWISEEGMRYIARLLGIPDHHVYGVVSFYTMFNRKPVGRHKIEVCTNVSCMLRNSERILKHIENRLAHQGRGDDAGQAASRWWKPNASAPAAPHR